MGKITVAEVGESENSWRNNVGNNISMQAGLAMREVERGMPGNSPQGSGALGVA